MSCLYFVLRQPVPFLCDTSARVVSSRLCSNVYACVCERANDCECVLCVFSVPDHAVKTIFEKLLSL